MLPRVGRGVITAMNESVRGYATQPSNRMAVGGDVPPQVLEIMRRLALERNVRQASQELKKEGFDLVLGATRKVSAPSASLPTSSASESTTSATERFVEQASSLFGFGKKD